MEDLGTHSWLPRGPHSSVYQICSLKMEEGGPDTNANPFPVRQKLRGGISEAEGKCMGIGKGQDSLQMGRKDQDSGVCWHLI